MTALQQPAELWASQSRKERIMGKQLAAEVERRMSAEARIEKAEREVRNCDLEMRRWKERAQRAEAALSSMGKSA